MIYREQSIRPVAGKEPVRLYLKRRATLRKMFGAGVLLAAPAIAQGAWPDWPVRVIVPYQPGQATDIFTRILAELLSRRWKQPVIIDNIGGGSGIAGIETGRAAAPDGHTLIVATSGTFGINPSLYPDLPYRPLVDFMPISLAFTAPLVVVAHPSFPANSLREMIALIQREPGRYSYASPGVGSSQHLSMEWLKVRTGLDIHHIADTYGNLAVNQVLSGQVMLMKESMAAALPHLRARRLKALAVTTLKRVAAPLDYIPAVSETIPGFNTAGWAGLVAPVKTPPEIVARISFDLQGALREPAVIARFEANGTTAMPTMPAPFSAFIRKEMDNWAQVVRATGTKPPA